MVQNVGVSAAVRLDIVHNFAELDFVVGKVGKEMVAMAKWALNKRDMFVSKTQVRTLWL